MRTDDGDLTQADLETSVFSTVCVCIVILVFVVAGVVTLMGGGQ